MNRLTKRCSRPRQPCTVCQNYKGGVATSAAELERQAGRDGLLFEVVYTCPDWYDGPRGGIADYQGEPHLFLSEGADGADMDAVTFLLSPVNPDVFQLAIEDWAIWRRWETAFYKGEADQNTHPALPPERARHEELKALLSGRLKVNKVRAIRKLAEFRVREDPAWSGFGFRPLEVRWLDPA